MLNLKSYPQPNKKTRNRAYDILVEVAHAFEDEERGGSRKSMCDFLERVNIQICLFNVFFWESNLQSTEVLVLNKLKKSMHQLCIFVISVISIVDISIWNWVLIWLFNWFFCDVYEWIVLFWFWVTLQAVVLFAMGGYGTYLGGWEGQKSYWDWEVYSWSWIFFWLIHVLYNQFILFHQCT